MTPFDIVVAADEGNGIGKDGEIQWHLPGDLKFLKRKTTSVSEEGKRNAVIMGRKTWETIPAKWQPLPKRLNVVVTRRPDYEVPAGVVVAHSVPQAVKAAGAMNDVESVFVLGGGEIYRLAIDMESLRYVYLTRVEGTFPADAQFPDIDENFELIDESDRHEENGVGYRFQTWERR